MKIYAWDNVVPAAEWFVDNFYMIEEHMKEIRYNLSRRYLKTLPILMEEGLGVIRYMQLQGLLWISQMGIGQG